MNEGIVYRLVVITKHKHTKPLMSVKHRLTELFALVALAAIAWGGCVRVYADELQAALDRGGAVTVTGSFTGNYVAPPSVTSLRDLHIDGTLKIEGGTFGAPKPIVLAAGQEKTDLSPGVWCVMDNRLASWSAWRDEYRAGEFLEVKPGGYLARPVQGSYPAIGNCVAYQLTGANPLTITGLTVRAPDDSDEPAFTIHQRVGVTVRDSTVSGGRVIVFDLNRCLRSVLDNVTVECFRDAGNTIISEYGLCVHNCQDVMGTNINSTALRHAVTIGGDSLSQNLLNQNIRFTHSNFTSYGVGKYGNIQSFHVHGNADNWSVDCSRITGGIVLSGNRGAVRDCEITSRLGGQASIAAYFAESNGTEFSLTGNTIEATEAPSYSAVYGSLFGYVTEKARFGGTTTIARNKITGPPARLWTSVPWQVDYRDTHPVELRGPIAIQSDGHEIRFPKTVDDCTLALQATIKSLPLNPDPTQTPKGYPTGGTIRLAPGTLRLSQTIEGQRGLRLIGAGHEATQLVSTAKGSAVRYLDAGRYTPDEIEISNLSIWQDATTGAGIEIANGPATVQAVGVKIDNVLIEGSYDGILLAHGLGCSVRNSLLQKCKRHGLHIDLQRVSTTTTIVDSTYATSNGVDGFHVERGGYIDLRACGSDSNGRYGYAFVGGGTHSLHGGAEENAAGAVYAEDTRNLRVSIHAVDSGNVNRNLVTLRRTVGTAIESSYLNKAQGSGWGVAIVEPKDKVSVRGNTYLGVADARRVNEPGWTTQ